MSRVAFTTRVYEASRCSVVMTCVQAALIASACAGFQKHAIEYSVLPRNANA